MSADPQTRETDRRWTGWEFAGLIVAVWMLAILLFFVLTVS